MFWSWDDLVVGFNMVELCFIGIGGDMFILYWDVVIKLVKVMNGLGCLGVKYILEVICKDFGFDDNICGDILYLSVYVVIVFGVLVGWIDIVVWFGSGKVSMLEIFVLVIKMGE